MRRILNALPLLVVAWGLLAFGAVYSWAFTPLAIVAAISGAYELWVGRRLLDRTPVPALAVALFLLIAAVGVQLIPLPCSMVARISPGVATLLTSYVVGFTTGSLHSLSIAPRATLIALALLLAFGTFLLGLVVRVSRRGATDLAGGIAVLGAAASMVAIVQRSADTQLVYGFWRPTFSTTPYGPFINRNHFAGWMLMALPLTLAYAWSRGARASQESRWRRRLAWLSSKDANQAVLSAFVSVVMAMSLMFSASRSGAIALVITLVILGAVAWRTSDTRARKPLIVYGFVLVVFVFGWSTTRELNARFVTAHHDFAGRMEIWSDTMRVVADAPLTGTGLNTYGASMLFYQRTDPDVHFVEAHNDYLQLAAEGGILICVPAAVFIGVVITAAVAQTNRYGLTPTRAGALAGLMAIALQEVGDFSLQMPGNVVLFCVLLAAAVAPRPTPQHVRKLEAV
ncbi:MAG: hypothetical protein DMG02_30955 [Acidobacteria bacterium]|nr:MAG: hypothetical protein DMG02_30955 [Acidobacteriota bacterium]